MAHNILPAPCHFLPHTPGLRQEVRPLTGGTPRPPTCAPAPAQVTRGLFRGVTPPLLGGMLETGINYMVRLQALAQLWPHVWALHT